ncbi:MAG: alpha/beta hydrolase [Gammaproteobacteria bacterium]|nr:MAG: alpha/beta hydrolase [Gammaproteobacteria bacterium]
MTESSALLPCVELNPPGDVRASVIWLHGLGADGHDFEAVVPDLGVQTLAIRFVFPHAPSMPVTINNGSVMPAWYDIVSQDFYQQQDQVGIERSGEQLRALIRRERDAGIAAKHIILAGFSQGGAIVLHTGLRYPHRLGGIMALSTYLPLADSLEAEAHAANKDVPIFMAQGTEDPVVPPILAENSKDLLVRQGYPVEWHRYDMPHAVVPKEINDIAAWLRKVLK